LTSQQCNRLTPADLTDYAAGELSAIDAASLEAHLFTCSDCGGRATELDALARATREAVRSAMVGGFVTDAILNRLSREGVRVRTFVLSPGAIVPCAVWDDDELMVLRLRGDFGSASEFTLSQRVAGAEVWRATGQFAGAARDENIHVAPAVWIRQLPVVDVDVRLTALDNGEEREMARYTLLHDGHEARR
jgi:anti-sigma factor RsiW